MTLLEVLKRATGYLQTHGSTSPRLDAELLLAHALGLRRLDLYLQFDRPLRDEELVPYRELTARRGRGEPVAYLVGRREFMGLTFEVTPDVLVPNPDTEVLVQRAVEWARLRTGDRAGAETSAKPGRLRLADIGTGSGCIAVSVAHYLPEVTIEAADISVAAIAVARRNVAAHGLEGRVAVVEADLLKGLTGPFDAILANLPYLAEDARLPAEVTAQPAVALFGGATLVNRLLAEAPARLSPGGIVLLEVDPAMIGDLRLDAYSGHRLHRDLGGHQRVLEAWM